MNLLVTSPRSSTQSGGPKDNVLSPSGEEERPESKEETVYSTLLRTGRGKDSATPPRSPCTGVKEGLHALNNSRGPYDSHSPLVHRDSKPPLPHLRSPSPSLIETSNCTETLYVTRGSNFGRLSHSDLPSGVKNWRDS